MKFAHEFEETLREGNFPDQWVQSAIRYRLLKKCIKKVQQELTALGLDAATLASLVRQADDSGHTDTGESNGSKRTVFEYTFEGDLRSFRPMLVFTIDSESGEPLDATLSENTKKHLQILARRGSGNKGSAVEDESAEDSKSEITASTPEIALTADTGREITRIEVPLKFDAEFFRILSNELSELDAIQSREEGRITGDIVDLGKRVSLVAAPLKSTSKTDLYPWREIFRVYLEGGIFFSTLESDHGTRSSAKAQERLQWFAKEIQRLDLRKQFRRKESLVLLDAFVRLNGELLQALKFQEINKRATSKILKKFDKRTALGAKNRFPDVIADEPILSQNLAKGVCFTMSEKLFSTIPQIEEYLCPICSSISFKPVRLHCGHVFCIRCMIMLQRDGKRNCPMCREAVVLDADSANLDVSLHNFLKQYFPKETKEKQRENERALAIDRYGPSASKECAIM